MNRLTLKIDLPNYSEMTVNEAEKVGALVLKILHNSFRYDLSETSCNILLESKHLCHPVSAVKGEEKIIAEVSENL